MADGDLTPDQAAQLVGPRPGASAPAPLLPRAQSELDATSSVTSQNAPPAMPPKVPEWERHLGATDDVPFHPEGLDVWTDLMAKSRENTDDQIRYLAKKFGAQNVRLNEYRQPVVRIKNTDTGKMEDYPLDPHQLTVKSLTSLARFAPDVALSMLAVEAGGPMAARSGVARTALRALLGGAGAETAGVLKNIGTQMADRPLADVEVTKPLVQHLEQLPADVATDLGLAGIIKGGQIAGMLASGKVPNPIAGSALLAPAKPELTTEGVAAAARNQARSGIYPALRGSEITGIPFHAMLERYLERLPAGASPQVAASTKREQAAKALQRWMIDPSTLATDEEVGRRGLNALKKTVQPYEEAVTTAEAALKGEEEAGKAAMKGEVEAAKQTAQDRLTGAEQAKLLSNFRVKDIPDRPLPYQDAGEMLRKGFLDARDAFWEKANALYDKFFDHPKATAPLVSGDTLKRSIDDLRKSLPKVVKETTDEAGQAVTTEVPFSTPVRSRLDELSEKLSGGKVSINDLKQVRTDIDNAIKTGEAIPGVKEGRLKQTYAAITDAINKGLGEIKDPELSQAWREARDFYKSNVDRFTEKNVARLAKEADQASSVGNRQFAMNAITSEDSYTALRDFYGLKSPEMMGFRDLVKKKLLQDSIGSGETIDGNSLVRALQNLRSSNGQLYKDTFAGKGNQFIKGAEMLGTFQRDLPLDQVEKILSEASSRFASSPSMAGRLAALQTAQKNLNKQYQNQIIGKFLKGDLPAADIHPEKFVSSLPDAKLSDVQDVMARLESEAPDVAEQVRRKSVQNLLQKARRTPQPQDTMAKLQGEPGDLVSGTGISEALGKGDQLEKYKVLLGDLYDPLVDYAKTELLGEERLRVAQGVGMLAPGSAVNSLIKALTPWEAKRGNGMMKELSGLARDKIFSILVTKPEVQKFLLSPHRPADMQNVIKTAIISEPFLRGMKEEFKDDGDLHHALSVLKTWVHSDNATGQPAAAAQGNLTPEQSEQAVGPRPK